MRRLFIVLLTLAAIAASGWLALRRADIPYDTLELTYSSPASKYLTLSDGLKAHYRDVGPRNAPAIIMVHGFSASLHTWEDWVTNLKRDYRVISVDLPGHGLTRVTETYASPTIGQFVEFLVEVADQLNIAEFTLVGSSMGGNTAWSFALDHPDRLDGLVLVAASGWDREDVDEEAQPLIFRLLDRPMARRILRDIDLSYLIENGLRDSFADESYVTPEMVARYTDLGRAPGHREFILALTANRDGRVLATANRLSQISVPTLILHGDADAVVPVSGAEKFAKAIPGSTLIIYENVGHLPQEEVAKKSVEDLRAFLSEIHVDKAATASSTGTAVGDPSNEG